jgi:phenylpropionate dioxygenase-like ring-hydroxylating dioxygenase large terminal subunit
VGDRVHAWRDLCLHRGTRLSLGSVQGETLVCAYHGWTYNGEGRCVRFPAHPTQTPPAKAQATVYQSQVKYGWVWVCLGQPERDIPSFPEWNDSSFRKVHCGPYHYRASGPRAIENFLDVTHFPFVHTGLLGDPNYPEVNDYQVEITPEGVIARDITVWQPDPDGSGQGANVTYTYKVLRPLTAYFVKSSAGPRFAMYFTVTPVSPEVSIAWTYVGLDYGEQTDEEIRAFEDKITWQDIPVVESQRPELLPLDLQAELHLRSDRTAVAYRTWLRQLGLSFGTA